MALHFIRPEWLLLLIPLALLSLLSWRKQNQQSAWQHYIAPHLSQALISASSMQKKHPVWLLGAAWFIAVLAASGPAITKQNLPVFTTEQGRVLVMDMSLSMLATDMSPNRLSQAKFRASDLLNQLKEGETGLIAYAGDAFTISPLTRDTSTLLNLLPSLSPDIMPAKGSDLGAALTLAQQLLAQGGHIKGDIIVLTDGISAKQFDNARAALKGSRYRLSILALGSEQGAPIRLADGQLLKDNSDTVIVAKTNYGLLQKLVRYQGGIMIPAQADGSDLRQLQDWLASDGEAKASELEGESWQDLGPYLALLLIIPCLLSFRHGLLPLVAIFCLYQPLPAQASVWDDLWQTRDQQANKAFEGQDFSSAAENFVDPQWRASAQYKAGDFEQALAGFEKDKSAAGLYNQGNALMQLGKNTQAIKRYQQALALQPDFPQAAKNAALAEQAKKEKQQSKGGEQPDGGNAEKDEDDGEGQDDASPSKKGSQGDDSNSSKEAGNQSPEQQGTDANEQQDSSTSPKEDKDNPGQDNRTGGNQQSAQQNTPQDSEKNNQQAKQPDEHKADASSGADNNQSMSQDRDQMSQPNQDDNKQTNSTDSMAEENDAQMQAEVDESKQKQDGSNTAAKAGVTDLKKGDTKAEKSEVETTNMLAPTQVQTEALPADMERALRSVSEDPQVLLRNKMQLEYLKRRQQTQVPEDNEQW
jgi:Ca-activated chloride channel family protein